jgi:phosphatidylserine/phosphatidylglycerophosphate/cardiolipin synthase-like enzyme
LIRGRFVRAYQTLRKFQLRDHRKLAIFDSEIALVGSSNIGKVFDDWRETTVELTGPGVQELIRSFIRSWRFSAREKIASTAHRSPSSSVFDNFTVQDRAYVNRKFRDRVRESRRLWMTTAYFHPRPKLVLALLALLRTGADLRILVPRRSDIAWFPWLSRTAFVGLISRGAKIFEYDGPMLHAKTTIFDRHALVGSRNMNYRSFVHDLEIDVELSSEKAMSVLEARDIRPPNEKGEPKPPFLGYANEGQ